MATTASQSLPGATPAPHVRHQSGRRHWKGAGRGLPENLQAPPLPLCCWAASPRPVRALSPSASSGSPAQVLPQRVPPRVPQPGVPPCSPWPGRFSNLRVTSLGRPLGPILPEAAPPLILWLILSFFQSTHQLVSTSLFGLLVPQPVRESTLPAVLPRHLQGLARTDAQHRLPAEWPNGGRLPGAATTAQLASTHAPRKLLLGCSS